MRKSLLFRLFGLGAIPQKIRPTLDAEEIVTADEGIRGWYISKNVKAPGKRCLNRAEGFLGSLVVTKRRIVCFTYGKRQMNILVEDPKITGLSINVPKTDTLSISFESSVYREGWTGLIAFQFKTEKARQFYDVLISLGAQGTKNL